MSSSDAIVYNARIRIISFEDCSSTSSDTYTSVKFIHKLLIGRVTCRWVSSHLTCAFAFLVYIEYPGATLVGAISHKRRYPTKQYSLRDSVTFSDTLIPKCVFLTKWRRLYACYVWKIMQNSIRTLQTINCLTGMNDIYVHRLRFNTTVWV